MGSFFIAGRVPEKRDAKGHGALKLHDQMKKTYQLPVYRHHSYSITSGIVEEQYRMTAV